MTWLRISVFLSHALLMRLSVKLAPTVELIGDTEEWIWTPAQPFQAE